MNITEETVLKTLVDLMDSSRTVSSDMLLEKLNIPDYILIDYLEPLRLKGYTVQVYESITLTDRGLEAYHRFF